MKHDSLLASINQTRLREQRIAQEPAAVIDSTVVAFVRNVSFTATGAKQLVDFLNASLARSEFAGSIIKCSFKLKPNLEFTGMALVYFTDRQAFDYLRNIHRAKPLVFKGQTLYIKLNDRGQVPQLRARDSLTKVFSFAQFQLGYPPSRHSNAGTDPKFEFIYGLKISGGGTLEFHRNARHVSIHFMHNSSYFLLNFASRHVLNAIICTDDNKRHVLILYFDRPPLVFSEPDNLDYAFAKLLDLNNDKSMNWDAFGESSKEWQRTTDPCDGKLFGSLLAYRFILTNVSNDDIMECLKHFNLPFIFSPGEVSVPHLPSALSSVLNEQNDWSNGCDRVFAKLPFSIRYMIHALMSVHKLYFPSSSKVRKVVDEMIRVGESGSLEILNQMYILNYHDVLNGSDDPYTFLVNSLKNWKSTTGSDVKKPRSSKNEDDIELNMVRRVHITPLRICPKPADSEVSNRFLRHFHKYRDRFIRVTFVDEAVDGSNSSILFAKSGKVIQRVRSFVQQGVLVAGRTFVFLAYSNSQLREQSCWFYHEDPSGGPTATQIRDSIGDLSDIKIVGKFAARLGQALSSSEGTESVKSYEVITIPDIQRGGFIFSDGVGMISSEMAIRISSHLDGLPKNEIPSAFQIRFRGAKGMVAVAPDGILPNGIHLAIRPSMIKFTGPGKEVEVCSFSKPIRCYLNRQIIVLLSSLGIGDQAFLELLKNMLLKLDNCLLDNNAALVLVREHYGIDTSLYRLIKAGFSVRTEHYIHGLVRSIRDRLLLDVQLKARILVSDAICLVGILDESDSLPEGSVFFQIGDRENGINRQIPVGTRVAITRNPCMHPGDIRVLRVADIPCLRHLVDVLVFSAKGKRPNANQMSGGDLDGDIFSIIWDSRLVPDKVFEPMSYKAPTAAQTCAGNLVQLTEICDFFVDYIINDNLGRICNAHLTHCDQQGAFSKPCLELANLASIAVDFNKTGVPAMMPRELSVSIYPHFMNNPTESGGGAKKYTYKSKKVLGVIYDLSISKRFEEYQTDATSLGLNRSFILTGNKKYIEEASLIMEDYNYELWDIMLKFGILDESEVLSGFARQLSRKVAGRGGDGQVDLNARISQLQKRYLKIFWEGFDNDYSELEEYPLEVLQKASAWYEVTYSQSMTEYFPLLSFGWICWRALVQISELPSR